MSAPKKSKDASIGKDVGQPSQNSPLNNSRVDSTQVHLSHIIEESIPSPTECWPRSILPQTIINQIKSPLLLVKHHSN